MGGFAIAKGCTCKTMQGGAELGAFATVAALLAEEEVCS